MFRSMKEMQKYSIQAKDGDIGAISDFLFDEKTWMMRYIVVDTGNWLPGRKVLLNPFITGEPLWAQQVLPAETTMEEVRNSPPIDTDRPVSRQKEIELFAHYEWTPYWAYAGAYFPPPMNERQLRQGFRGDPEEGDPNLRSFREIKGYHIAAVDGDIGHIEDLIVNTQVWKIQYVIIDTRNWLPGKHIIIAHDWLDSFDWSKQQASILLKRDVIEHGPEFDPSEPVNREYETRLYDYYGRPKYWEKDYSAIKE